MPESQQHGFLWESNIKSAVFGLSGKDEYTAVHDIPSSRNRFDPNETISVKTTGNTTLCMGDALRLFDYESGVTHTCIAIRHKQCGDTKVLTNVYELDLTQRDVLWGSITRQDIEELNRLVRSMPINQRDPDIDKAITQKKRELNAKSGAVRFNPKINSNTQRRLQCSIPMFASYHTLIKSSTTDAIVRGIPILASILCGRRVRNRRV